MISLEDDYLRRVDESQSPELVRMQLDVMNWRADRYASDLRETEERHEQELAQEKALTTSKDQDLARERKKIRELQAAIREVEEGLLGLQPASKKSKVEDQGTIKSTAVPEKNLAAPIASSLSLRNGDEPIAAAP